MITSHCLLFKIFTDFILPERPTTVKQTLEIFKNIAENFGEKKSYFENAIPMKVQMMPLNMVSCV